MKTVILAVCITLCCVVASGHAADEQSYGPVRAKETLYRIALRYRQPGVTVSQLMMAIFEANPQAFDRGNINRLKLGATLKIPEIDSIASLDRRQAYLEASAQIDTYEQEVRAMKAQQGEAEPLAEEPRDPDLESGAPVVLAVSEPGLAQIEEVKLGMAADEQQPELPEPKPARPVKQAESSQPLFRYSYDISLVDDDNVRNAQDEADIREDVILSALVKATGGISLDDFSLLNFGGSAVYNKFDTFDTLDNYEFEVNTRYRFATGSSFTSPIYTLGAKIGGAHYPDSEMRDATFVALNADFSKWLTNTINMTTGIGLTAQEAKSEVFDLQDARIFINFDTNFSNSDLVYTTFSYINGDTVSSSSPTLAVVNAADAIEPDDAFGGIEANQFAYRIDANTLVFTIGYNRILTRDISLDFSYRYVESQAIEDPSVEYQRTLLRASLLGRF